MVGGDEKNLQVLSSLLYFQMFKNVEKKIPKNQNISKTISTGELHFFFKLKPREN